MIEYDNEMEQMEMACDEDYCDTDTLFNGSWSDCIEWAKENGWKIIKRNGEWKHICFKHNYEHEE